MASTVEVRTCSNLKGDAGVLTETSDGKRYAEPGLSLINTPGMETSCYEK